MLNYILLCYGVSFVYHLLLVFTLFFKKDIFPKIYNFYYKNIVGVSSLDNLSNDKYYDRDTFPFGGYTTTNSNLIFWIIISLLFPIFIISFILIAIIPVSLYCLINSLIEKEFKKFKDTTQQTKKN